MANSIDIPLQAGFTNYKFSVVLVGVEVVFEVYWNVRANAWFLSAYDTTGAAFVEGRKMVPGADLWRTCRRSDRPRGALTLFDSTGKGSAPNIRALEKTHFLVFTPQ